MYYFEYLIFQIPAFQKYYVVDDKLKDYVMGTAHKKWRDFKADLKKKFFEPEKTDEELHGLISTEDNRVSIDDCKWLVKFWRSEEAEVMFYDLYYTCCSSVQVWIIYTLLLL
jgi:hypothetical protein